VAAWGGLTVGGVIAITVAKIAAAIWGKDDGLMPYQRGMRRDVRQGVVSFV
jgi:hypothetical protein